MCTFIETDPLTGEPTECAQYIIDTLISEKDLATFLKNMELESMFPKPLEVNSSLPTANIAFESSSSFIDAINTTSFGSSPSSLEVLSPDIYEQITFGDPNPQPSLL